MVTTGYQQQQPVYPIYGSEVSTQSPILGVPKVEKTVALICLLVNIFMPGFGTLIGAIATPTGCDFCAFVYGILQILLTGFGIGWIWSVVWGLLMYQSAYQHNYLH